MALEALKQYAAEQNQATQAEIDKLLKNDALKRPISHEKGQGNIKPLVNKENVIEALQERLAGAYKEYQQNIKTSSQLQTEILKGARAGEDIYSLFLKAVKAISLMTSDTVFYSQLEDDIKTIYGAGLGEPQALELELSQTEERLRRLEEVEAKTDGDEKKRLQAAIKAHKERITRLKNQ